MQTRPHNLPQGGKSSVFPTPALPPAGKEDRKNLFTKQLEMRGPHAASRFSAEPRPRAESPPAPRRQAGSPQGKVLAFWLQGRPLGNELWAGFLLLVPETSQALGSARGFSEASAQWQLIRATSPSLVRFIPYGAPGRQACSLPQAAVSALALP